MARAEDKQGGASRLVGLKAVAPGYPLRGQLTVSAQAGAPAAPDNVMTAIGELRATGNYRRIAEELWPMVNAGPSTPLGDAEAHWMDSH